MDENQKVIIIHESIAKSLARDAGSFATILALIGVGVLLESDAMQWIGAIIGFIIITGKASGLHSKNRRTISEARDYLDEIERKT